MLQKCGKVTQNRSLFFDQIPFYHCNCATISNYRVANKKGQNQHFTKGNRCCLARIASQFLLAYHYFSSNFLSHKKAESGHIYDHFLRHYFITDIMSSLLVLFDFHCFLCKSGFCCHQLLICLYLLCRATKYRFLMNSLPCILSNLLQFAGFDFDGF